MPIFARPKAVTDLKNALYYPLDDVNLDIPGYNSVRADHPANAKCGNVSIYFQKTLLVRILDVCFLHECINFETRIRDKVCNFIAICITKPIS